MHYSIGGVGTGEKFTEPYQQANNIAGTTNCETCAAYNMLKLTKMLNNYDPDDAEYMDYYERTLYNQILASQTPNVTDKNITEQPICFRSDLVLQEIMAEIMIPLPAVMEQEWKIM